MSKVYVVQETLQKDYRSGALVPKFNLEPAKEYGELVHVLGPNASPFNADTVIPELHEKLSNFREGDYLLLIGNPALIGMVCAVAAHYTNGNFSMLQWSGKERRYLPIDIHDLYFA